MTKQKYSFDVCQELGAFVYLLWPFVMLLVIAVWVERAASVISAESAFLVVTVRSCLPTKPRLLFLWQLTSRIAHLLRIAFLPCQYESFDFERSLLNLRRTRFLDEFVHFCWF